MASRYLGDPNSKYTSYYFHIDIYLYSTNMIRYDSVKDMTLPYNLPGSQVALMTFSFIQEKTLSDLSKNFIKHKIDTYPVLSFVTKVLPKSQSAQFFRQIKLYSDFNACILNPNGSWRSFLEFGEF